MDIKNIKKCVIQPSKSTCRYCTDLDIQYGEVRTCDECIHKEEGYILSCKSGFFGSKFVVLLPTGYVKEVPVGRVKIIE